MQAPLSFEFHRITLPRFDCTFLAVPTKEAFEQFIRVEVLISDDSNLKILFGIKVSSVEKIDDLPKVDILVEMIADFKLSQKIPNCEKLSDVPCLANMAAVMFPFAREKVHYFMSANNYTLMLGSLNVAEVIKQGEGKPGFSVSDLRKTKQMELQTEG